MSRLHLRLILAAALLGADLAGCSHSRTPEETVRGAYDWYVKARLGGGEPLQSDEANRYLTRNFVASLRRSGIENEIEPEMLHSSLELGEMKRDGRLAKVRLLLKNRAFGSHSFATQLRQEDGRWKIDDVKMLRDETNED